MEALTRLVSESLARHGFDRPVDYRRLRWSQWFRCESHHSLLAVPSKPGVFALAEEIMNVGTAAPGSPAEQSSAIPQAATASANIVSPDGAERLEGTVEERRFSAASAGRKAPWALAPEGRCLLAVTKFFEDDDMAFTLDRMLTCANPMRSRLATGHYFVRFVVIEDVSQRRSVCNALNQWIANSAEKATGIGAHFASSLEITESAESRSPFPSGF